MKKVIIIIVLFATMMQAKVKAQSYSLADIRCAKITAILIYEDYVDRIDKLKLRGDYDVYHFMETFGYKGDYYDKHKGDTVYNDIVPLNQPQYLSALMYSQTFDSVVENASFFGYNGLIFQDPKKTPGGWQVTCTFNRKVSFVTLDSVVYPPWIFSYTMTIAMSDTLNIERRSKNNRNEKFDNDSLFYNARVVKISVLNPLDSYVVISNPEHLPLMWEGKMIEDYYPECQCWMTQGKSDDVNRKLKINSTTGFFTRLNQVETRPNFYSFTYNKNNLTGLGLAVSPYGFGNRSDNRFEKIDEKNSSFKLSLFYGKQLSGGESLTPFFNFGADIVYNRFSYNGVFRVSYQDNDSDGDLYTRFIDATLNNEQRGLFEVTVPLTFSLLKNVYQDRERFVFLSFEAGAFGSVRVFSNGFFDMEAKYRGYYPQYFNVEMDHYYDYGDFQMNESSVQNYNKGELKRFDYGLEGGAGVWVNIGSNWLFRFDLKMRMSFAPVVSFSEYDYLTSNYNHYESMLQTSHQGQLNLYLGMTLVKLVKGK